MTKNTEPTIYLWHSPEPHPFHDQDCKCSGHCQNCRCDLKQGGTLGPKARYCGEYCKGVAKRERALDRALQGAHIS